MMEFCRDWRGLLRNVALLAGKCLASELRGTRVLSSLACECSRLQEKQVKDTRQVCPVDAHKKLPLNPSILMSQKLMIAR